MDEVIIEKQEYLLFDKYKLNTNRNITRYEYISNVPLKVSKREPDMRVCKCGAHLITLAFAVIQDKVVKTLVEMDFMSEEAARNWCKNAKGSYDLSIEKFVSLVQYLEKLVLVEHLLR